MIAIKRDEVGINGAKGSAINTAREWVKRLIDSGATPEEIKEVIDEMAKQARAEARIGLDSREAKGREETFGSHASRVTDTKGPRRFETREPSLRHQP